MVKPPLPAVGEDAPHLIGFTQVKVDLVAGILIGERIPSALRFLVKVTRPCFGISNRKCRFEKSLRVNLGLRLIEGIDIGKKGIVWTLRSL